MASTYTDLGLELMATGENAGTWGTKTNANLSLVEQLTGGYNSLSIAGGAQTTALTIAEGALTGTAQHRVIELTGSITGNQVVTFPLLTENFYFIKNNTSGAYTVQLKAVSGSGATVTFATTDKLWKIIWLDGVATNTGVYEVPFGTSNGLSAWVVKTGTYTAVAGDRILANTNGGAFTITLPASPSTGDTVNFVDQGYDFNTNALTVGRNSSNIANAAADLVVNTQGAAFGLVYSGDATTGWTYTEK
jgi:hypothetical protein